MYEVEWLDAVTYTKEEKDVKKPYKNLLVTCISAGLEVRKDKDCVIIISEKVDGETRDFTVIPKGWVKRITKYEKKNN